MEPKAVCMKNERGGYEEMQGYFGLPSCIASDAKRRCSEIFEDFQLQAVCMSNEKDDHEKTQSY